MSNCLNNLFSAVYGKLLLSTTQSIMEVDVDTQSVTELVELGGIYVMSMDYDYKNKYVYFPRIGRGDIVRYILIVYFIYNTQMHEIF